MDSGGTQRQALTEVRARAARHHHGLYVGAGQWSRPEAAMLVIGPPRAGKTAGLVVPNVLAANGPVLSTSTKDDVLRASAAARAQVGPCWVFDPGGQTVAGPGVEGLAWSPVQAAITWVGALAMARAMVGAARPGSGIVEASHWTERAEAILAPLLHAAALDAWNMADVLGWVNRRDAGPAGSILTAHRRSTGASLARDLLTGITSGEERELSGIWSTASGTLAAYRSESVLASTEVGGDCRERFNAQEFVNSSGTIYVCADTRVQALTAPLVAGLVEEVRRAAYARWAQPSLGTPPGAQPPVLLALDEVANIAPLADLPAMVSEGGGQGMVTLACLQDLSQARARWGVAADGFLSLFGTKVVLSGVGDVRTLEALSSLAGSEEAMVRSRTFTPSSSWLRRPSGRSASAGSGRGKVTTTHSTRRQPRLPIDVIAQGRPQSALMIDGADRPSWVHLTPWYSSQPWLDVTWRGAAIDRSSASGRDTPASTRTFLDHRSGPDLGR
ncbi:MAG: type IV secretory system conjugative DNA transfer family protein [Acidimicrobiales bacterium]